MDSIKLFYFSGTGNSLFVAKLISEKLNAERISIAQVVDDSPIFLNEDIVGLIFPIHYIWNGGIPEIIKRFIAQVPDISKQYVFAVCTNGGGQGDSLLRLDKLLKMRNNRLSAGFSLRFPYNYIDGVGKLVGTKPASAKKMEAVAIKRIDRICQIVVDKQRMSIDRDSTILLAIVDMFNLRERLGKPHYQKYSTIKEANAPFTKILPFMDNSFRITSDCNLCGNCSRICPVNNITMTKNGPEFLHHCEQCFACLQFCTKNAIQFGTKTVGLARYTNSNITIAEMTEGSRKA